MKDTIITKQMILIGAMVMSLSTPISALSETPIATRDISNTRLYNFVDIPAEINYSQFGEAGVQLDPRQAGHIISVRRFRKINILIGSTSAKSISIYLGKLSDATLAQEFHHPIDGKIHTYDVIGPELAIVFKGGTPNSSEKVQMWVFLSS
ncbi:hypothetical protein [Methylocucumis oryzae]|uniref:Uncharacterized protein n=1 Tax=Methylocucumis oryzae TaxID=1632867 RepID=A0A0F3IIZ7_9GAMM|nr:hypothetical protein [Methylocucumis oryzae]KJV06735.1 hypothetical protein VZ94_09240 [Methylocucumis oryzae]